MYGYIFFLIIYLSVGRAEDDLLFGWPDHTGDGALLDELVTDGLFVSPRRTDRDYLEYFRG